MCASLIIAKVDAGFAAFWSFSTSDINWNCGFMDVEIMYIRNRLRLFVSTKTFIFLGKADRFESVKTYRVINQRKKKQMHTM